MITLILQRQKNNLPDPYDLLWILYQDIKNDNVKNGAFVSLLDSSGKISRTIIMHVEKLN